MPAPAKTMLESAEQQEDPWSAIKLLHIIKLFWKSLKLFSTVLVPKGLASDTTVKVVGMVRI